jgi:hypothetical protein
MTSDDRMALAEDISKRPFHYCSHAEMLEITGDPKAVAVAFGVRR